MDEEGNEEDEGIQIFIETLTGTKYHLQVSRLETVISLKARIQKYEGVPIIHQHLVFQGNELDNEAQLGDSLLYDGATLRLVISMRGGPINMRRVSSSDSTLLDVKEFMEANQEEIWEHLPSGEPVTLLMYRDGDQVNLYRVIETTDGHFSPLSQSWNGHAIRNLFWEDEEENRQRSMENRITQSKMEQLKLDLRRKKKASPKLPFPFERRRRAGVPSEELIDPSKFISHAPNETKPDIKLPPITASRSDLKRSQQHEPCSPSRLSFSFSASGRNSLAASNATIDLTLELPRNDPKSHRDHHHRHHHRHHRHRHHQQHPHQEQQKSVEVPHQRPKTTEKSTFELNETLRHELTSPTLSTVSEIRGLSFNVLNDHEGREVLDILNRHRYLSAKMSRVHTAQKKAASLKPPETEKKNERSLLEEMQGLTLDDSGHCQHRLHASQGVQLNRFSPLPPLVPLQRRTSDRPRCTRCRKKLTLTTIFSCHCGKSFCAIHRYAEAHGCSFDYKSEGRKVLEKGNPLITAPKLPKI